jgi:hypothetical protein
MLLYVSVQNIFVPQVSYMLGNRPMMVIIANNKEVSMRVWAATAHIAHN